MNKMQILKHPIRSITIGSLSIEEKVNYLEKDAVEFSERINQLEYQLNEILDEIYQLKLRVRRLEER